jgi:hypothetical protein
MADNLLRQIANRSWRMPFTKKKGDEFKPREPVAVDAVIPATRTQIIVN